ncbi:hypothetical protein GTW51_20230 [Aurantimonas aggregata]|uniref:Uncharacterized protein n=1 Tax=Aurantimonas aggregata TaxID=2047720 RepID=A0A6L9MNP2_9HYPH|nr:hypothetical protein [Aurantimonas aggregata]NDV89008.1 hypothetical protein [Aurantimonas aggregata]
MDAERELREAVNGMLDSLDAVVKTYGGLDPYLLVDLISEQIEFSHDRIEAVIREEASKRAIPLLPARPQTQH